MRTTIEILDAVKRRLSITSDYRLAKELGVTVSTVSGDRNRKSILDNSVALRAAELLDVQPIKIIAIAEAERAKAPERKKKWEQIARVAVIVLTVITGVSASPSPTAASGGTNSTYYVKRLRRRLRTILSYMQKWTFALFLGLTLQNTAFATDSWSSADQAREATYLSITALDWAQTRFIARHPDEFYEINPLLGKHPSIPQVNRYFLINAAAHVLTVNALPARWRGPFQYGSIAWEVGLVAHNYRIGIRLDF